MKFLNRFLNILTHVMTLIKMSFPRPSAGLPAFAQGFGGHGRMSEPESSILMQTMSFPRRRESSVPVEALAKAGMNCAGLRPGVWPASHSHLGVDWIPACAGMTSFYKNNINQKCFGQQCAYAGMTLYKNITTYLSLMLKNQQNLITLIIPLLLHIPLNAMIATQKPQEITIPIIGNVTALISNTKSVDDRTVLLEGKLTKPFNFLDSTVIVNPSIRYEFEINEQLENVVSYEITGDANILGFDVIARVKLSQVGSKNKLTFEGELKKQEPFRPFADNPLPLFNTIALNSVSIGANIAQAKPEAGKKKKSPVVFYIQGVGTLLNIDCNIKAHPKLHGLILEAEMVDETPLTDIVPRIKDTPLKNLSVPKLGISVTPVDYYDEELDMTVKRGVSLYGTIDSDNSAFDPVRFLLHDKSIKLNFLMTLETGGFFFSAGLPTTIKIPMGKTTLTWENTQLFISLDKAGAGFGIKTRIRANLPKQDDDLFFVATGAFEKKPDMETFRVAGSMLGTWEHVFGFKHVSIGDCALQFGRTVVNDPPSIFKIFGITGKLQLSDDIAIAGAYNQDTASGSLLFMGAFDGTIKTNDLLSIPFKKAGKKIPPHIPDLKIKDVEFKLASQDTYIGDIFFARGLTMKGDISLSPFGPLDFKGVHGFVDINIPLTIAGVAESPEVRIIGSLSKIKIGEFFELTGKGLDQKAGTADDGPTLKYIISTKEQIYYLSGEMVILGFGGSTDITVSPKLVSFKAMRELFGVKTTIEGTSSGSIKDKNLDFKIKGSLVAPTLLNITRQNMIVIKEKVLKKLTNKRAQVQKDSDKYEALIKNRTTVLYNTHAGFKKITDAFNNAQDRLNKAEQKTNALQNKIHPLKQELEQELKKLKTTRRKIKHGMHAYALWVTLKTLKATHAIALAELKMATASLAKTAVTVQTFSDPQLILWQTLHKNTKVRVAILQKRITMLTNMLTLIIGSIALIKELCGFTIKELSFSANARGFLKKGNLPVISCTIMDKRDKTFKIVFDADIDDLDDMFLKIVYSIFNKIKH